MKPIRPLDKMFGIADKARTALTSKPGLPNTAALQAARARAQDSLKNLDASGIGKTPVGEALRKHIRSQLAKGEGLDEFQGVLIEKAKSELAKRKHLVSGLQDLARTYFFGPDKLRRLRLEVLQPARTGQLSTAMAWQRIDDIAFGRSSSTRFATRATSSSGSKPAMFPILEAFERKFGNVYFALMAKAEAAVVLGGGASFGVGGMRHSQAFFTASYTVGLGCSVDAQGGLEIAVSMQKPETSRKITFEVAAGGGYGVTGELTVSFKPTLGLGASTDKPAPMKPPKKEFLGPEKQALQWFKTTKFDGMIFDYEFDGASLNIGAGAGADFSTSIALGESLLLKP